MPERSRQLISLKLVEAPGHYWAQILDSASRDNRLSFDEYRRVEHPYVEQWWERHWDLADRLLDDDKYDHIRVNVFDAEAILYRYTVIAAMNDMGAIVLIEFSLHS